MTQQCYDLSLFLGNGERRKRRGDAKIEGKRKGGNKGWKERKMAGWTDGGEEEMGKDRMKERW